VCLLHIIILSPGAVWNRDKSRALELALKRFTTAAFILFFTAELNPGSTFNTNCANRQTNCLKQFQQEFVTVRS
jgi:hypothetical protein